MNGKIHYSTCPVCGSSEISEVMTVKDHPVSGEVFTIVQCSSCTLRFTQDVPDASSISPYYRSEDYISHTDQTKGLIGTLYKKVRSKTLTHKRRLIEKVTGLKKGNFLDIGSGTGAFVNEMKKSGWQVRGIEPDEGARSLAKKLYGIELDNEKKLFQITEHSLDAITLWHVLEHVHDLQSYVQQLKLLLKKNGKLFIAVPNYTSLDSSVYKEFWAAYDVPRHLYHFSPLSMQCLMEKNGMKIVQHKPMWYDGFYISLLSSKYKTGKSRWISSFFNGLRSDWKAMMNVKKCSSVIYVISE